jgi:hypothetical protein
MNRIPRMMIRDLSLLRIVPPRLILQLFLNSMEVRSKLSGGSMSSSNCYKEKDGGARLEDAWHGSMERSIEGDAVTVAMGLRSAWMRMTGLSSTVPAAHIQEQSTVP